MEIGAKIKQLRYKSGLTQEQLAARLNISAQSVSKWETGVAMPDITLLPMLAGEFGVSVDELFDLTAEQKLCRIENRMEVEEEFSLDIFREYEEFLKTQLTEYTDKARVLGVLAGLYHHRMQADAKKVSKYAREAIKLRPEKKECQWYLDMAEGHAMWDWDDVEHSAAIDFYKEVIREDKETPGTPLPYYYLMDNLLADHRTKEAAEYLEKFQTLPAHKPFMAVVYRAHIALAEFDEKRADGIIENGLELYADNGGFLFEAAQYYAKKCRYSRALELYERSWVAEEKEKPRYTSALYGMLKIYGIMGDKKKMIATYDRILDALKNEWKISDDDRLVVEVELEKGRVALPK